MHIAPWEPRHTPLMWSLHVGCSPSPLPLKTRGPSARHGSTPSLEDFRKPLLTLTRPLGKPQCWSEGAGTLNQTGRGQRKERFKRLTIQAFITPAPSTNAHGARYIKKTFTQVASIQHSHNINSRRQGFPPPKGISFNIVIFSLFGQNSETEVCLPSSTKQHLRLTWTFGKRMKSLCFLLDRLPKRADNTWPG